MSWSEGEQLERYARVKVPYYVIFDPAGFLSRRPLRVFELTGLNYVEKVDRNFPEIGLGLTLWDGQFDGLEAQWLRWVDPAGEMLAIAHELAERVEQQARRVKARSSVAKPWKPACANWGSTPIPSETLGRRDIPAATRNCRACPESACC